MNTRLLQILKHPPLEKEGSIALAKEFVVDPRLRPYLVSAAKDFLMWIERPLMGRLVRAAVRYEDFDAGYLFRAVMASVVERGKVLQYGNYYPPTEEGILKSLSYLNYFLVGPDITLSNPLSHRMELLVSPDSEWAEQKLFQLETTKVPVIVADWLPEKTTVAVPLDRGFLGDVHLLGDSAYVVVVHNPSRGMAVTCPE